MLIVWITVAFHTCAGDMSPKIVNGIEADIEQWPFIAYLVCLSDKHTASCGGSLISSQTILTAAHCLDDVTDYKKLWNRVQFTVMMGNKNILQTTMIRKVIDYTTFYNYEVQKTQGDIGIAFLEKPVTFSNTVKKAVLIRTLDNKNEYTLLVAGWGAWANPVNQTYQMSKTLLYIRQNLMSRAECEEYISQLETGVICAAGLANKYVFRGDSGGPLVTGNGFQVGVVSYKLSDVNWLTVYTSIPYYIDWIKLAQERLYMKHCHANRRNGVHKFIDYTDRI